MSRHWRRAVLLACALFSGGLAQAQPPGYAATSRYLYNPMTGTTIQNRAYYNPFTGAGAASQRESRDQGQKVWQAPRGERVTEGRVRA